MDLVAELFVVFFAFCVLMAGVLGFCLYERRKVDGIGDGSGKTAPEETPPEKMVALATDAADDKRVMLVLGGSIVAGGLLALLTAYLVFFRA
jgi:hypothetical protein